MNRTDILTKKKDIMSLLQIDELRYGEIIEEIGYEFIEMYFPGEDLYEKKMRKNLMYSSVFWIWWLYRWNDGDGLFLLKYRVGDIEANERSYKDFHRRLFGRLPDYVLRQIKKEHYAKIRTGY